MATPAVPPVSPLPLLPQVLTLMEALWAVAHGLEQTSKRMRREIGITGPQRLVIRVVGLVPGIGAKDLAAVLHVHPSTLTGVLQRLERQRLIVREPDPRDRRRACFRLGPAGVHVNGEQRGTVEAAVGDAMRACGEHDSGAAIRVLRQLARTLTAAPGGAPSVTTARRGPHARRLD